MTDTTTISDIDMARLVDEVNREVAEMTRQVLAPERWPEVIAQAKAAASMRRLLGPERAWEIMEQERAERLKLRYAEMAAEMGVKPMAPTLAPDRPPKTAARQLGGIPDEVRDAFDGVPHLTMPQLAKAMRMDLKTLKGHREAQNLPVHIKGNGLERRHYVCTLNDVVEFYRRTGEACQSSESRIRPTINSTSKSKVIAFTARPKAKMNVRLRKSRKRSGLKPPNSSPTPLRPAGSP